MSNKDKKIFAVTEAGKPVTIRSRIYDERLNATTNGSLIITRLTREDQGIYTANILRRSAGQCVQFYNLVLHGLPIEDLCGETRHVSHELGGEVVLPVQQSEVQDITWMMDRNKNIFAVTEPGKPVIIRSLIYDGRLKATADGSLVISKLTREDQGIYKGSVLRWRSGQCVLFYNLTVYASFRNSSITPPLRNISKMSSNGAITTPSRKQATAWIIVILCVFATAVLMLIFIVSIVVSRVQEGTTSQHELLYCDLDLKRLQKGTRARNTEEETTITYSFLRFSKTTKNGEWKKHLQSSFTSDSVK
ncbi:hypothetical protein GDO81_014823 [Engystomops pustulosus]|uniref:Uncharacterized protein n=2 Tax=Engystomops pustulosus TaxID=76066 RepID=A0AAV7AH87_ENGPU|nr:hypothetical protein GDO81_014823 [Engystomops pustulosus]